MTVFVLDTGDPTTYPPHGLRVSVHRTPNELAEDVKLFFGQAEGKNVRNVQAHNVADHLPRLAAGRKFALYSERGGYGPPTKTYRYTLDGEPMTACPCGHDLTDQANGVTIHVSTNAGATSTQQSYLEADGTLHDPHGDVANGLHAGTACGGCGDLLIDVDATEEEVS